MKIVRRGALPVGGDSGLLDVRDRGPARSRARSSSATRRPSSVDIYPAFVERVLSFIDPSARSSRFGSSSTPATGWPARCCRRSSNACRSTPCAASSSPTARSRTTSRTRCFRRTASSSSARSKEEQADLGIAFDGDADRCFFVDDTGEFVPGDFVTALLAESMLEKEPGAKIIYDVRASWAVADTSSSSTAARRS